MGPLRAITGERRAAETALQVLPFPADKGRWHSKGIARGQSSSRHTQAPQWHLCWYSFSHLFLPETPRPWDNAWEQRLVCLPPEVTLTSPLETRSVPHAFTWYIYSRNYARMQTQFWKGHESSSRACSLLRSPKVTWKPTRSYMQGELASRLHASASCTPWFFLQLSCFKAFCSFKPTEELRE